MCSPKVNLTYLRFTEDTNICDNTIKNKLKNEVKELLKLLLNDKDKSNASTVIKNHSLYEVPLKMNGLKLKTSNNSKVIELNTDPKYFNTDCNCKLSLNKTIPFDFTNSVIRKNGLDVQDNHLMINYDFNSLYLPFNYSASKNLEFLTECPLTVKNKKLTLEYDKDDFMINQGSLTLNQPYLYRNTNNSYIFSTNPTNSTNSTNNNFFPYGGIDMGDNSTLNFHNNSRIVIDNTYVNTNGNCIPNNPKGDYNFYISIDKDGHPSFKQFPESDINNLTSMKEKYDTLLADYKQLQTTYESLEKEIMKYLPADGSNDADMTSIIGTSIVHPENCHPHDSTKDDSDSNNNIIMEKECDTSHCHPSSHNSCDDVCDTNTCGSGSGSSCGTGGTGAGTGGTGTGGTGTGGTGTGGTGTGGTGTGGTGAGTGGTGAGTGGTGAGTGGTGAGTGGTGTGGTGAGTGGTGTGEKKGQYLKFDFGDDNFFFINDDE